MKKNSNNIDNRTMHFNNAARRSAARRRRKKRNMLLMLALLVIILAAALITYGCRAAGNNQDSDPTAELPADTTTQQPEDDTDQYVETSEDPADTQDDTQPAQTSDDSAAENATSDDDTETAPGDETETTADETEDSDTDDESAIQDPPSAESPVIALTFDDGPAIDGEDRLTERLLDTLAEEGVEATFFVLGTQIAVGREDIVLRTWQEGHEIANHSYSHVIFTETDEQTIRDELTRTNELIENITGEAPRLMRPPTGAYNDLVRQISREMDMAIVNWSWESTPQDWNYHDNPQAILDHVLEYAANGHIVLLHDINRATVDVMPEMIAGLKELGFRFMTVSDMLSYLGEGHPEAGAVYTHFALPSE